MKKVFIDGSAGTTGLRIFERLSARQDLELITLTGDARKDPEARKQALNSCDIAFLCLPDAAAMESVSLIENDHVTVLDTSTAHRTNPDWAYGFPEISAAAKENTSKAKQQTNGALFGFLRGKGLLVGGKIRHRRDHKKKRRDQR